MARKKAAKAASKATANRRIAAPKLPYEPRDPKRYRPNIGLIAAGGITWTHLKAYKAAGYKVVAICDLIRQRAVDRSKEFFPKAAITTDYREVLARDDIEVVDVATHPQDRAPILEDALRAGKHVLSQKPFVLDLDFGRKLVQLADRKKVKLAVNQNGRWAPHFSYIRHAIAAGLIGDVIGAHLSVHWDHNWVKGTSFEKVRHVILYDFAIHWYDILTCFMGGKPAKSVHATFTHSPTQLARPALLAQAMLEYPRAQASLIFDADTRFGGQDRTYVAGTKGTIVSTNVGRKQKVTLYTAKGQASPVLRGSWFPDGFHGTMGELLRSIEEDREPTNSGRNNLNSLAVCFAGIASAEKGKPFRPGDVKKLQKSWM